MNSLKITEIFYSLQGEGRETGFPTLFIRLANCNLRCSYCDTHYSFEEGRDYGFDELEKILADYEHCRRVLITGGEPLLQERALVKFIQILLLKGWRVSLETNGTRDLAKIDSAVHKVVDVKLSGSEAQEPFFMDNLEFLTPRDEVKFVISSREDFVEALEFIDKFLKDKNLSLIFSPVWERVDAKTLSQWILDTHRSDIKLGLQLHKIIGIA